MHGPRTQLGNRGRESACREASRDGSIVDTREKLMTTELAITREELMTTEPAISVNERAAKLVARLIADAAELRVGVCRGELGETLIDSGSRNIGSVAAGLRIAEICTGGLASVQLAPSASTPRWPWMILVQS